MNDRSMETLDYFKIRERLVSLAVTPMGRERCNALLPSPDPAEVQRRQAETAEMRRLVDAGCSLPLGEVKDIRSSIWWAATDTTLKVGALQEIRQTLAATQSIVQVLLEHQADAPALAEAAQRIALFPDLEAQLGQAITADGTLADNASPDLARIRSELQIQSAAVRRILEAAAPDLGGNTGIVVRQGRYLVRVKAEQKDRLPGVVHETGAGGATLLIEPLSVVDLNNELGRLGAAEREAASVCLRGLSEGVGAVFSTLRETQDVLGHIDVVAAKAALGAAWRGVTPVLSQEGRLVITRGRHPLLQTRVRVIPLDIQLGVDFDMLVVSGSNTGGKTVVMKTVGLFCLMAQAGLQIPAAPGTELPVYPQVYADIGDEQSLEQNLSTFSSHMGNIAGIVSAVEPGALVLLDEVGAGTDPTEGAALGMAVLDYLHKRGARVIATTHYGELKNFAATRPRAENASMEFDLATLKSTYRLLIGVPGESQALTIARRLGLKQEVVDEARRNIPSATLATDSKSGRVLT